MATTRACWSTARAAAPRPSSVPSILPRGRGNLVYGNVSVGITAAYNTRVAGNTVRNQTSQYADRDQPVRRQFRAAQRRVRQLHRHFRLQRRRHHREPGVRQHLCRHRRLRHERLQQQRRVLESDQHARVEQHAGREQPALRQRDLRHLHRRHQRHRTAEQHHLRCCSAMRSGSSRTRTTRACATT